MRFTVDFICVVLLSVCALAQDIVPEERILSAQQQGTHVPELVMQNRVRGFVYCPEKEAANVEISFRSAKPFPAKIRRLSTDKKGYFNLGNVPAGRYQLVVKNKCSTTTTPVNDFDVVVQSGSRMLKDCLLEEVIVKLKNQSSPEISYRSAKNASCG